MSSEIGGTFQTGRGAWRGDRLNRNWLLIFMNEKRVNRRSSGIWIIDGEGKTAYANESMAEILGTTPAELIGEDSFDYVFPEDREAAERLFAMKQAGSSAPFQFKLQRKDGAAVWVDVQGTPMHNAARQFIGVVSTFTVADAAESEMLNGAGMAVDGQRRI
jgi:PAS domain S-box-containing protein